MLHPNFFSKNYISVYHQIKYFYFSTLKEKTYKEHNENYIINLKRIPLPLKKENKFYHYFLYFPKNPSKFISNTINEIFYG